MDLRGHFSTITEFQEFMMDKAAEVRLDESSVSWLNYAFTELAARHNNSWSSLQKENAAQRLISTVDGEDDDDLEFEDDDDDDEDDDDYDDDHICCDCGCCDCDENLSDSETVVFPNNEEGIIEKLTVELLSRNEDYILEHFLSRDDVFNDVRRSVAAIVQEQLDPDICCSECNREHAAQQGRQHALRNSRTERQFAPPTEPPAVKAQRVTRTSCELTWDYCESVSIRPVSSSPGAKQYEFTSLLEQEAQGLFFYQVNNLQPGWTYEAKVVGSSLHKLETVIQFKCKGKAPNKTEVHPHIPSFREELSSFEGNVGNKFVARDNADGSTQNSKTSNKTSTKSNPKSSKKQVVGFTEEELDAMANEGVDGTESKKKKKKKKRKKKIAKATTSESENTNIDEKAQIAKQKKEKKRLETLERQRLEKLALEEKRKREQEEYDAMCALAMEKLRQQEIEEQKQLLAKFEQAKLKKEAEKSSHVMNSTTSNKKGSRNNTKNAKATITKSSLKSKQNTSTSKVSKEKHGGVTNGNNNLKGNVSVPNIAKDRRLNDSVQTKTSNMPKRNQQVNPISGVHSKHVPRQKLNPPEARQQLKSEARQQLKPEARQQLKPDVKGNSASTFHAATNKEHRSNQNGSPSYAMKHEAVNSNPSQWTGGTSRIPSPSQGSNTYPSRQQQVGVNSNVGMLDPPPALANSNVGGHRELDIPPALTSSSVARHGTLDMPPALATWDDMRSTTRLPNEHHFEWNSGTSVAGSTTPLSHVSSGAAQQAPPNLVAAAVPPQARTTNTTTWTSSTPANPPPGFASYQPWSVQLNGSNGLNTYKHSPGVDSGNPDALFAPQAGTGALPSQSVNAFATRLSTNRVDRSSLPSIDLEFLAKDQSTSERPVHESISPPGLVGFSNWGVSMSAATPNPSTSGFGVPAPTWGSTPVTGSANDPSTDALNTRAWLSPSASTPSQFQA